MLDISFNHNFMHAKTSLFWVQLLVGILNNELTNVYRCMHSGGWCGVLSSMKLCAKENTHDTFWMVVFVFIFYIWRTFLELLLNKGTHAYIWVVVQTPDNAEISILSARCLTHIKHHVQSLLPSEMGFHHCYRVNSLVLWVSLSKERYISAVLLQGTELKQDKVCIVNV